MINQTGLVNNLEKIKGGNKNSSKKKNKAPMLNPQTIDATKRRILNILNTKLNKRLNSIGTFFKFVV